MVVEEEVDVVVDFGVTAVLVGKELTEKLLVEVL